MLEPIKKFKPGLRCKANVYDDAMFPILYNDDIETLPICQNKLFDDEKTQEIIDQLNVIGCMSFVLTPEEIELIEERGVNQCQN